MKILHLLFHPDIKESKVNKVWAEKLRNSNKLTKSKDLYSEYPNFEIDVEQEQADLLDNDRIVIQFPFYWYSVPPLLKKYFDDVLSYGFAYGEGGDKLAKKEVQLIISTGGSEADYMPGGRNNFTIHEFLRPIQQTVNLCRMTYLTPMWMNGALSADIKKISEYGDKWVREINAKKPLLF